MLWYVQRFPPLPHFLVSLLTQTQDGVQDEADDGENDDGLDEWANAWSEQATQPVRSYSM